VKRRCCRLVRSQQACTSGRCEQVGNKSGRNRIDAAQKVDASGKGDRTPRSAGKESPTEERTHQDGWSCVILQRQQAQRSSKGMRYPEQGDRDARRSRRDGIASQTLGPRESVVCPLCTRKRLRRRGLSWWGRCRQSDVDPLRAKELDPLPSMEATLPVSPQDGMSCQRRLRWFLKREGLDEGMQHRADAPWVLGGGPMPLTALP
jgi:hypothetical protein